MPCSHSRLVRGFDCGTSSISAPFLSSLVQMSMLLHRCRQQTDKEPLRQPEMLRGHTGTSVQGYHLYHACHACLYRNFSSVLWDTPGGDFITTATSSQETGASNLSLLPSLVVHPVFLSGVVGSTLAFDVTADVLRAMVDARSNLGWLIKLDEETGTQRVISYDSGTIPGANPQISKPPC